MNEQYYVMNDDRIDGPFAIKQLEDGLSSGKLTVAHTVSVDKLKWVPLGDVVGRNEPLPTNAMLTPKTLARCQHCNFEIKEPSNFCSNCGANPNFNNIAPASNVTPASNSFVSPPPKKRMMVMVLGFLFGVHRFYLGYTGIGLLQMFVTIITFGIGAIWPLVDMIMIINNKDFRDASGQLLEN